jgi:hypothetical protein
MKELGLADRLNGIYGEYGLRVAKLTDEEKEAEFKELLVEYQLTKPLKYTLI